MRKYLTEYSTLLQEWDYEVNGDLDPRKTSHGSHKRVQWKCLDQGHKFITMVRNRTAGNGCPICSGFTVLEGFNDLRTVAADLASEWHPTKNSMKPEEVTSKSALSVWWVCAVGHEWEAKIWCRSGGNGCPFCSGHRVTEGRNDLESKHPELAKQWHPTKNKLSPNRIHHQSIREAWWVCPEGHTYSSRVNNRFKGSGCPICWNRHKVSKVESDLNLALGGSSQALLPNLKWPNGQKYEVDTLLSNKVVVEYDGAYWHQGRFKSDIEKTSNLIEHGYLVVRVREGDLLFLPDQPGLLQLTHVYGRDDIEDTAHKVRCLVGRHTQNML